MAQSKNLQQLHDKYMRNKQFEEMQRQEALEHAAKDNGNVVTKIKKRLSATPLPRYWRSICPEATSLWDISMKGCSIKTKVLLFDNHKLANKFLNRLRKGMKMEQNCLGIFHELSCDVYEWDDDKPVHYHEYDKTYIGFIVLLADHLTLEVISHECCHAAIAYSRRLKKKWPDTDWNPDEHICYPLGKLVAQVCSALQEDGYKITGNHGCMH